MTAGKNVKNDIARVTFG